MVPIGIIKKQWVECQIQVFPVCLGGIVPVPDRSSTCKGNKKCSFLLFFVRGKVIIRWSQGTLEKSKSLCMEITLGVIV